jgi:hypothetical protein
MKFIVRMPLVCIRSCLKSVLRYTVLILDAYHPDTLYLNMSNDVQIRGYFSKPKGVGEQKRLGNTGVRVLEEWTVIYACTKEMSDPCWVTKLQEQSKQPNAGV